MPIDSYNMLEAIENFQHQCKTALELTKGLTVQGEIKNIAVAGMGGSGIAGDILKAYMESHGSKIPVFVVKDYKMPEFVNESTLVFTVSYSGNTEETISAYSDAVKKKAKIVAVTSGGRLAELCKKTIKIPQGHQPRAALAFLFFPILGVLSNIKLISIDSNEIKEIFDVISDIEEYKNKAKQIIKVIKDKVPLIYSSNLFCPAAYRWKCQFNENSKTSAFCHTFSEMNHNEIVGFQTANKEHFIAIFLRDNFDNEQTKKRMDVTKKIICTKIGTIDVNSKGNFFLARMFSLIYLGDFVSYYLAMDKRIEPTQVQVIENLKNELRKAAV